MPRFSFRSSGATIVAAVALAAAGCGSDEEETSTAVTATGCEQVSEAPAPKQVDLRAPGADEPTATGVTMETSCGDFVIEFDDRAPVTAASFQHLVEQDVFTDTVFHRVIPGQLIQGGDPLGDGTGGPGYFVDERPPGNLSYTEGTVAMAKTATEPIGRSGSQFFVVASADLGLTPDYALLGRVTEGLDVVRAISERGTRGADGPPTMPVILENVTLNEEGSG